MSLSNELFLIAMGEGYNEMALFQAANHPVCTSEDEILLQRYWKGYAKATDHVALQDLANRIEAYIAAKA